MKRLYRVWMLALILVLVAGCGTVADKGQDAAGGSPQGTQEADQGAQGSAPEATQGTQDAGPEATKGASAEQVTKGGKADIAMVTINLQALFFNQMVDGAKKAAKESGASLSVFNANNDAAAQNTAIENYVQQKVDGIIVVAIDVEGIKPAIQKAADAKIPVVAVDAIVESPAVDVGVGVDNAKAAEQMAEYYNKWAKENNKAKSSIGVIGALNSFIQNQRKDAFVKKVEGSGHKIAQTVDGQNVQETAQGASETLFTANPNMDTAYATGEPALIGAVAAARSQNVTDRVKLFGWDLSESAIKAIDDGFLVAVVQQDPYTEGVEAVNAVMKLKAGEKVKKFIDVPITIVTKENVDKYRDMFK